MDTLTKWLIKTIKATTEKLDNQQNVYCIDDSAYMVYQNNSVMEVNNGGIKDILTETHRYSQEFRDGEQEGLH